MNFNNWKEGVVVKKKTKKKKTKKFKVIINKERCKGCELCVVACKKKVLKMSELRETNNMGYRFVKVVKIENCIGCTHCAIMCGDTLVEIYSR